MMQYMMIFETIVLWVVAHTTQLLATLLVIAIPPYLYWRSSIKRAIEKKLQIKVTRNPTLAKEAVWHKRGPLLQYLELDASAVATLFPNIPMLGLGEYMASLETKGSFSLQRALISVMDRYGLRVALPLALFAPPAWREEGSVPSPFKGTPYASVLLSNTISTLGLLSVSAISQRYNMDMQKEKANDAAAAKGSVAVAVNGKPAVTRVKRTALELMVTGSNPDKDGGLSSRLKSSFQLPQDVASAAGPDYGAGAVGLPPSDAPAPSLINALFPDLALGNGGLKNVCSHPQGAINAVMASICNRLAANSLIDVHKSPAMPTHPFKVDVAAPSGSQKSSSVTSVEDLIAALEGTGHTVSMFITTNVTSFGVGLCVDDSKVSGVENWTQVPLAYPLMTGLYARTPEGQDIDVVTLMMHSSIHLEVVGPSIEFAVEWCLSIEGTTGWLPKSGICRPWQDSPGAAPRHAEAALATSEGRHAALRLTTTSAAVLNVAASEGQLLFGGYGFLGVCIDSVAAIQQALTGGCTLYPLILGGDAKMGLLHAYHTVQAGAKKNGAVWDYETEANMLRDAISSLPCDAVVEPAAAVQTAQRALASLPEQSVFAAVGKCRLSLNAAIATAQKVLN